MDSDFIYWRHRTPIGVKIEEITGGDDRSPALRRALAMQVWKENGREGYRELEHLECGAPILWGEASRISLTHTGSLLAIATLPPTPEADLHTFSPRTALGIDAERADRRQVLDVRPRFLNSNELSAIPASDTAANILAWTSKEALYKAALTPGLDCRTQILISSLPSLDGTLGAATVVMNGHPADFILYSYLTGENTEYIVTIAISPRTATFTKEKNNDK